jgi:hypothetical protein
MRNGFPAGEECRDLNLHYAGERELLNDRRPPGVATSSPASELRNPRGVSTFLRFRATDRDPTEEFNV